YQDVASVIFVIESIPMDHVIWDFRIDTLKTIMTRMQSSSSKYLGYRTVINLSSAFLSFSSKSSLKTFLICSAVESFT
ncbi:MAG: hypothetical protein OXF06_13530, partial [Bacteroidetes bacterium]|nr:hypothetical protein [Bacteroidota bacterium]